MLQAVNFISDGLRLSPEEFAHVLQSCVTDSETAVDSYALGGTVEQMEEKFAQLLGKQRAIFMPTGTMANHIALRTLSTASGRVIVQADSHIYRDIGDAPQTLSGLHLVPLCPGQARFTLADVEEVLSASTTERVATQVKVISIETPVRRHDDTMFGYEEIRRISQFARSQGIAMHLDGARLFIEAVHSGHEPARYADHFDTVFVSLSKCFNSASGAILAGSADAIDGLFHTRRMFGGSLPQAWPQAAVALHYADGFTPSYTQAWHAAEALFSALEAEPAFRVERIPDGTHIVRLHVAGVQLDGFRSAMAEADIHLAPPVDGEEWLTLKVNPSIHRSPVEKIAAAFRAAATR